MHAVTPHRPVTAPGQPVDHDPTPLALRSRRRTPKSAADIREFSRADARAPTAASTTRPLPIYRRLDWHATAVDITRLDKRDPTQRAQINAAWRRIKADSADDGQRLGDTLKALRRHFPNAGIEVPADTLGGDI